MSTIEKDMQPAGFVQPGALEALARGPVTGRHQISARRDQVNGFTQAVFTSADKDRANQFAETRESVIQQQSALQNIPEIIPESADPMHIDDRLRMIGAEPAYLTVVFKLPSLNDAQPLIAQLPYGQKALGTEAVVFGMTTGNLMEVEPCAD